MKPASCRLLLLVFTVNLLLIGGAAQDLAPSAPQKLTLHSNVLNEDRVIWVRTPHGYDEGKGAYPVLYLTDGPAHINEVGSIIDFLADHDFQLRTSKLG